MKPVATRSRLVSSPAGFRFFQELEQRQNPAFAARERKVGHDVAGEGDDGDAVEIGQRDIGQGRGHLPGKVELRRLAKGHAPRAVEQEVDVQVFFFLKPLEQQFVETGEEVPVEVAEVVAGRVFAVIGELDAGPHLHGPPLGHERAAKHALRDQREVFELFQEIGVE